MWAVVVEDMVHWLGNSNPSGIHYPRYSPLLRMAGGSNRVDLGVALAAKHEYSRLVYVVRTQVYLRNQFLADIIYIFYSNVYEVKYRV